jgi:hypothetical protein
VLVLVVGQQLLFFDKKISTNQILHQQIEYQHKNYPHH